MKVQYHVNCNLERLGLWPTCREVSIREGSVVCHLSPDRSYDLLSAYAFDPHLRLMQCGTDEQVMSFARTWGPLYFSVDEFKRGVCSAPLSRYRTFQEWLRSLVNLLASYQRSRNEHDALREFIMAEIDEWRSSPVAPPQSEPLALLGLNQQFGIKGDVSAWIENSSLGEVRSATRFLVSNTAFGGHPSLDCIRQSGKNGIEARWAFSSLEEALRWMIWYDQFTQHPLVCCDACRRVFRPATAHARKYCTYDCAHRVAAREWQRKHKKTAEVKGGTRKTR